ncbi:hypothetical protein N7476_010540 [Penicillium atrosanguineum]|uniref:FAD/NAD(P)-binding domain-containing protein n=2 Tax=Penicillium atrosanguineum TaxID=1132637 RepID=A0A9W9PQB6_9EURO|nr:hypothetical protein N7476_010540 [Penicillium atrosanguineum]
MHELSIAAIGENRQIRVVCLGAGYSGLMMAIAVREKFHTEDLEFQVYEKNADLGGTWLVNRYPGCQCDIPTHNYQFSFEPKPDWPNYYATSEQIHQYMTQVACKYRCEDFFKYSHEVVKARWDDEEAKWHITVKSGDAQFVDICDVFINAGGVLNNWNWPSIPGISSYRGKLLHSADWDLNFEFQDKTVAVIGIGSSGVQIMPELAKVAKSVTLFARSPTWISPSGIGEPGPGDPEIDREYKYTERELIRFRDDPQYLLRHRKDLQINRITGFRQFIIGTPSQLQAMAACETAMREILGTTDKGRTVLEKLLPDFPVGCRRLTPGLGFLEAFTKDNTHLEWKNIREITKRGILTSDGRHLDFDAICCATGFDNSFQPQFPVTGRNGFDLAKKWKEEGPEAYFGVTLAGMPNYFSFVGPNSPVSNGSLVQAIQGTAIYIAKCLKKMQTQSIRSMEISLKAQNDFNEHCQAYLKTTVWAGPCSSWYKQGTADGKIVAIYCGSTYHFLEALKEPRWEDYHFTYVPISQNNRFYYLGNGMTVGEVTGRGDMGITQTFSFEDYWNLFNSPVLFQ